MIRIEGLNAEAAGRLHEITILGRSDFQAFAVDVGGRRLTVWIMSDDALKRVEQRLDVKPSPPAEKPVGPPARKPVAITTGARETRPS